MLRMLTLASKQGLTCDLPSLLLLSRHKVLALARHTVLQGIQAYLKLPRNQQCCKVDHRCKQQ